MSANSTIEWTDATWNPVTGCTKISPGCKHCYAQTPANVWMGVSVENERYLDRVDHLRRVPAAVRFISFEPLLGPIENPDLTGIQWAIVGGESGPGARPIERGWVRQLRDRCMDADTAFFFKQWGGVNKKKAGRHLDGKTWGLGTPSRAARLWPIFTAITAAFRRVVILPGGRGGKTMCR